MAKKKIEPVEEKKASKPKPYGVYLNQQMRADLEEIAKAETGGNFHAVAQYAIKYFIKEYKAGRVELERQTVTKLKV